MRWKWLKEFIRGLDGIQGRSWSYAISARRGNHYCPTCNGLLAVVQKKQIVNSESEEAKNFDFHFQEGRMFGNIEFTFDVFFCENCDKELSISEVRTFEREKKKSAKKERKGKGILKWFFLV